MAHNNKLSRLMRMSWDIQRTKRKDRSKSLQAAWVIMQCEQVTVQYLAQKLNHGKPVPNRTAAQYRLFTN